MEFVRASIAIILSRPRVSKVPKCVYLMQFQHAEDNHSPAPVKDDRIVVNDDQGARLLNQYLEGYYFQDFFENVML